MPKCAAGRSPAHARAGDRVAIAAYLGSSDVFDHAVADFAVAYADNERDFDDATLTSFGKKPAQETL